MKTSLPTHQIWKHRSHLYLIILHLFIIFSFLSSNFDNPSRNIYHLGFWTTTFPILIWMPITQEAHKNHLLINNRQSPTSKKYILRIPVFQYLYHHSLHTIDYAKKSFIFWHWRKLPNFFHTYFKVVFFDTKTCQTTSLLWVESLNSYCYF